MLSALNEVLRVVINLASVGGLAIALLAVFDVWWDRIALKKAKRNGLLKMVNTLSFQQAVYGLIVEAFLAWIALSLRSSTTVQVTLHFVAIEGVFFCISAGAAILLILNLYMRRLIRDEVPPVKSNVPVDVPPSPSPLS